MTKKKHLPKFFKKLLLGRMPRVLKFFSQNGPSIRFETLNEICSVKISSPLHHICRSYVVKSCQKLTMINCTDITTLWQSSSTSSNNSLLLTLFRPIYLLHVVKPVDKSLKRLKFVTPFVHCLLHPTSTLHKLHSMVYFE